jgi:transcriptional regulator with XRE-family HTH domain
MEPGKRKEQKGYAYNDIGKRLKEIREALNHTLDRMSVDSGISRSYLAEFERGAKLPNSKYLIYLFKRHNVNLHYILGGKGERFNPPDKERMLYYNFGKFEEEIKELLYYITNVPHALYAVLGFFAEYKVDNAGYLEKFTGEKENEKEGDENKQGGS